MTFPDAMSASLMGTPSASCTMAELRKSGSTALTPRKKGKPSATEPSNLSPHWHSGKRSKSKLKAGTVTGEPLLTCFFHDGRNLNREIVKASFAWWFRKYASKDTELEMLESEARQAKVIGKWLPYDGAHCLVGPGWRNDIRCGLG